MLDYCFNFLGEHSYFIYFYNLNKCYYFVSSTFNNLIRSAFALNSVSFMTSFFRVVCRGSYSCKIVIVINLINYFIDYVHFIFFRMFTKSKISIYDFLKDFKVFDPRQGCWRQATIFTFYMIMIIISLRHK